MRGEWVRKESAQAAWQGSGGGGWAYLGAMGPDVQRGNLQVTRKPPGCEHCHSVRNEHALDRVTRAALLALSFQSAQRNHGHAFWKSWAATQRRRLRLLLVMEGSLQSQFRARIFFLMSESTKASDTFKFLRHVMRAILSVRPKCSHRCVSVKES